MATQIGLLLPLIPIEVLLSTKGLMFLLLSAYGGAMWTFLSGAPRVHTILVPDLESARQFYEQHLKLPEAELPLQYYYGYEPGIAGSAFDSMYFPGEIAAGGRRMDYPPPRGNPAPPETPGLWYQLADNVQIHVIPGGPDRTSTPPNPGFNSSEPIGVGSTGYRGTPPRSGSSPYSAEAPYYSRSPYSSGSGGFGAPTARQRHSSFDRDGIKALLKYMGKHKISHSVRSDKPLIFWVRDAAGQIIEFAEVKD